MKISKLYFIIIFATLSLLGEWQAKKVEVTINQFLYDYDGSTSGSIIDYQKGINTARYSPKSYRAVYSYTVNDEYFRSNIFSNKNIYISKGFKERHPVGENISILYSVERPEKSYIQSSTNFSVIWSLFRDLFLVTVISLLGSYGFTKGNT
jgi:hypothetical protein